jgi:L-lactate dehydrogenase complex protein LldF
MNVCPVYRQVGGHAYRSVYPGPVGAVLSPLLAGEHFLDKADLPEGSSLCGACHEVCPVDIPIPDLLLRLRNRANREGAPSPGLPPMGPWSLLASSPAAWKAALLGGRLIEHVPGGMIPVAAYHAWTGCRNLPKWRGGEFRKWLKNRRK